MTAAPQSRWRNRTFLLIFVPGVVAWLAVAGWVTWLYFLPVLDWVGGLPWWLQELVGTLIVCVWAVFLAAGLAGITELADRTAGTKFASALARGQKFGRHAKWHPGHLPPPPDAD